MAMKIELIKDNLKSDLKDSRYNHVLRVTEEALELNKLLNLELDEKKVMLAALLHDCAKNNEEKYFEEFKSKYNLKREEVFADIALAHAILGVYVAKEIYEVNDPEILDAIRWHTTGKEDMTLLEKLIFISDFTEPGRNFEDSILVRNKVLEDLDKGILLCLDTTIEYLIKKRVIINIETLKARNYLLRRVNE
ncbi:bis(5'-nucleosyl)-tetraphosphatase (symmetrical) YqeK [Helcococcus sueciensis]|uniref:bis(5'-nucleosyl)-tetraphosphatase (symmetrical) YqeK n=1 Tax=Helcococcus sueciensis TaxID=241555 RepID=UPI00041ADAB4|nr:bis(5'-nucleosyl)-tetraphosphatase (symmetrical) YqeK [Helcococcus sueciensis]